MLLKQRNQIIYTHTIIYKKKVKNHICRDKSLSQIINSNWTFPDTNSGIKKNLNPTKTVTTIKTKGKTQINYLLPEDDLKIHVEGE